MKMGGSNRKKKEDRKKKQERRQKERNVFKMSKGDKNDQVGVCRCKDGCQT